MQERAIHALLIPWKYVNATPYLPRLTALETCCQCWAYAIPHLEGFEPEPAAWFSPDIVVASRLSLLRFYCLDFVRLLTSKNHKAVLVAWLVSRLLLLKQ